MGATATKTLHEVEFRDVGSSIHINADEPGTIYDRRGEAVTSRGTGWMARIDTKISEEITLRKGTVWGIGLVCALVPVLIVIAAILIGYGRADQSQIEKTTQTQEQIQAISKSQERMEQKFEKLDERLQQQEKLNERIQGFKAGVAESQSDKK